MNQPSYQVLARKWRPQTFQDVVGQHHAVQALMNALEQKRLHHAYLFTGTRGVGKTTLARLVAKALNCEKGVSATPCCACAACMGMREGHFIDLIEIDAASKTRVEDIRELLSNAQYAPTQGRYKVYLVDEVHMLSSYSSNALLKTLEEPPAHVKFLLATTDPQKLPATVLSRCLQFNLRHLSPEQIIQQITYILEQENIPFEDTALHYIAKAAEGSMRDALSLLEQSIAYNNGTVSAYHTREMLGLVEQEGLLKLIQAIVNNEAPACLDIINQLAQQTTDFDLVLEELLSLLHQIALIQILAKTTVSTVQKDRPLTDAAEGLQHLAKLIEPEDIQLFYQIALIGRKDTPLAPTPKIGFEMLILRMLTFRPTVLPDKPLAAIQTATPDKETHPSHTISSASAKSQATHPSAHPLTPKLVPEAWGTVVKALNLNGAAKSIVEYSILATYQNNEVTLILSESQKPLLSQAQEHRIAVALSQYLGKTTKLIIRTDKTKLNTPAAQQQQQQQAKRQYIDQTMQKDPKIQAIIKRFDATIVHESVNLKETEQ